MKINLNFAFVNLKGEPIPKGKDEEDATQLNLKAVCVSSLLGSYQDERIDGAEKLSRYRLAVKISNAIDEVELTVEEIALIKKLIAKMFSVLVTGQVWEYIEKTN